MFSIDCRRQLRPVLVRGEFCDYLWIKLASRLRAQLLTDRRARKCFAVRSVGGHRVDRVGEHNHASPKWDPVARQSVRITRTVPRFMVPTYSWDQVSELGDFSNEDRTLFGVCAHDSKLILGESTRLPQDRGEFFVDLADVMKQSRGLYPVGCACAE